MKEISITNFRCFPDDTVQLAVPDGSAGSGLNLFVGNNGTGKTTVLEAVDYLFGGRYKGENRLGIRDFRDFEKTIKITGISERYSVKSGLQSYRGKYFNCTGFEFTAKSRDRKQAGKLLSAPISAKSVYCLDEDAYYNENTDELYVQQRTQDTKAVDPRELTLDNGKIGENGVNVFYFDKNRARHLVSGTYRTTFDAICDDLNWKFQKKLSEEGAAKEYATKVSGELFTWALDLAQKGTGSKLGDEFSSFFDNEVFKQLRFELVSLLEPFSSAFLAIRKDDDVRQIPTRGLGSGVELILALLLQRLLSDSAKGDKILLIDEPEMHLHPTAQRKLAELLLDEVKNNQVIVSCHSPYMLQALLARGLTNVFTSSDDQKINIEPQSNSAGLFPWSPSFGEVNFKAFAMPTVEFHNELYGYIQESQLLTSCPKTDDYLETKGVPKDRSWINTKSGKTETVSLCTYVRHSIHHPENQSNSPHDEKMLEESIRKMLPLV